MCCTFFNEKNPLIMENLHRYYLLVGDENAWKVGIDKQVWGFSLRNIGLWNTTKVGDFVAFYVTSPTKKIIGFGIIREKFDDESLLWNEEKFGRKSIWKYKLRFDTVHVIKNWSDGLLVPKNIMLNVGRKVVSKELFESLIKEAEKKWKTDLRTSFNPN